MQQYSLIIKDGNRLVDIINNWNDTYLLFLRNKYRRLGFFAEVYKGLITK